VEIRTVGKMSKKLKKSTGKLSISHRSTAYPCSVPGLGRLAGAGRIGLTRAAKVSIRTHKEVISRCPSCC
jgi:hypothetical protein